MKNSELRRLVAGYMKLAKKQKKNADSAKLAEKLREIEHGYFHETGITLESDLNSV